MFFRATALKVRKAFRKKAYLVSTSFIFIFFNKVLIPSKKTKQNNNNVSQSILSQCKYLKWCPKSKTDSLHPIHF